MSGKFNPKDFYDDEPEIVEGSWGDPVPTPEPEPKSCEEFVEEEDEELGLTFLSKKEDEKENPWAKYGIPDDYTEEEDKLLCAAKEVSEKALKEMSEAIKAERGKSMTKEIFEKKMKSVAAHPASLTVGWTRPTEPTEEDKSLEEFCERVNKMLAAAKVLPYFLLTEPRVLLLNTKEGPRKRVFNMGEEFKPKGIYASAKKEIIMTLNLRNAPSSGDTVDVKYKDAVVFFDGLKEYMNEFVEDDVEKMKENAKADAIKRITEEKERKEEEAERERVEKAKSDPSFGAW